MNNVIQDELITEIKGLLLRKYPDYIFKEIVQDDDVNYFPGSVRITIFFWDMNRQRDIYVRLIFPTMELLTAPKFLIEVLITRIDTELKKLKEDES